MPVLQPESMGDLVTTTLKELGEARFTEIATDIQDHIAASELLRKNHVEIESGYAIQFNVMVDHSHSAVNTGIAASDNVNIVDDMTTASTVWRSSTANYGIDGRELAMNRTPRRIVNLLQERRLACLIALAELLEQNFWGFPSASDSLTPLGLPYWVTKNATAGFNGGLPSGYTSVAGLSSTTYPRWQNYTYQYVDVSKTDFIRGVRKGATKINFKPPVDGIPTYSTGVKRAWYANYNVIGKLEESLESQNDNLGRDVASMDGQTLLRRVPVEYAPWLDADTTDPMYGINWGDIKIYVLKDWWMRETNIPVTPGQHTMSSHFIDMTYQIVCKNRRTQLVTATGTSYPS